jgi:hypothetical protein
LSIGLIEADINEYPFPPDPENTDDVVFKSNTTAVPTLAPYANARPTYLRSCFFTKQLMVCIKDVFTGFIL